MDFKCRYVNFGTVFRPRSGLRPADGGRESPEALDENEIAVDVGDVCWGYGGEEQSILEHHFPRTAQFPSASAAVLHNANRIRDRFAGSVRDVIWLVSHHEPDFDAFCSMYLTRSILTEGRSHTDLAALGLNPDGWTEHGKGELNWFDPDLSGIPAGDQWLVLLAAHASLVDNCRRLPCPRSRALHSVLYAALKRGRDYKKNGAVEFFDHAKTAITARHLNPIFDSVLEGDAMFSPELAMLDRELEAYERDLRRSRRAVVHLQRVAGDFQECFESLKAKPLLAADLSATPEHLNPSGQTLRSQADGVYLRDPECLLFKEWARLDSENSSMGAGFLFTAVAYSNGRAGGPLNHSDYF